MDPSSSTSEHVSGVEEQKAVAALDADTAPNALTGFCCHRWVVSLVLVSSDS